MKIIQIKRREDMQRVKLYGIQSASVLRVYKESVYFYRLCDAMEVCQHLNNQEQNKRLNRKKTGSGFKKQEKENFYGISI